MRAEVYDVYGSASSNDARRARCVVEEHVRETRRQVRYENLQPKYEITTPEQRLKEGALPVWSVFDPAWLAEWQKQYLVALSGKDMDLYLELYSPLKFFRLFQLILLKQFLFSF